MFASYRWATVGDEGSLEELRDLSSLCAVSGCVEIQLDQNLNNVGTVVTVAASKNHWSEPIIDLFRWLVERTPTSYGPLYVQDDASEHSNEFRVWRLARGALTEFDDPFLSPCIPTLEHPWESGDESF